MNCGYRICTVNATITYKYCVQEVEADFKPTISRQDTSSLEVEEEIFYFVRIFNHPNFRQLFIKISRFWPIMYA